MAVAYQKPFAQLKERVRSGRIRLKKPLSLSIWAKTMTGVCSLSRAFRRRICLSKGQVYSKLIENLLLRLSVEQVRSKTQMECL